MKLEVFKVSAVWNDTSDERMALGANGAFKQASSDPSPVTAVYLISAHTKKALNLVTQKHEYMWDVSQPNTAKPVSTYSFEGPRVRPDYSIVNAKSNTNKGMVIHRGSYFPFILTLSN